MHSTSEIRRNMKDLGNEDWREALAEIAEEDGYFEPLAPDHFAAFVDAGPQLLVSFESRTRIRALRPDHLPYGLSLAQSHGWSSLTLVAEDETWFRDERVYGYFDRLIDEAFFEDFDRVVFYGEGAGGYAACAYSVSAPGATVVALRPQATLAPAIAGWDDRFPQMRRRDFTRRFGFAPDMMEGAGAGFVVFDPFERLDAMHAALFARPGTTLIRCRNMGLDLERMLASLGVLDTVLERAMAGHLTEADFWPLLRARHSLPQYLRHLAGRLHDHDRVYLEALLCRNVTERLKDPRFHSRYKELDEQLSRNGVTLPPPRL
ncbi:phosphoadenosine phosphosulfate reductase [Pseudothioclava arenosa]|uniref:Phosphoadenosine phosphosulfate reductase n=2 Tax=Pseudothioclava arenosa TaxID=1795308 RepID=A0A2A4CNY2_9RHOB|nr:phosphoadenosine phosphosulfate reductase [Pseudothioclava arenosa]